MGGRGSGDWYRWDKKTTIEDCRFIDINRFNKEGMILKQGHKLGGWAWTDAITGEQTASIGYESNTECYSNSFLRLFYTLGGETKMDYKVKLLRTRANYGSYRFWFECPIKAIRVSKLYLPPSGGYFASRKAHNLSYSSQSETSYDRLLRKKHKLQGNLGGDNYYIKPKGMHQKTYDKMLSVFLKLEEECDIHLFKRVSYML